MSLNTSSLAPTSSTLDGMADTAAAPKVLTRAASQVEDLARRGIDRARETSAQVKDQVARVGDRSVGYVRDEPVKSLLIAAAAGAAVAGLLAWMTRSRTE
jgi:ElaB/YqjD/DUF883 family membrane-anchored ribosome-binding protein